MDRRELVFFTDNIDDWNYNILVTNPDINPFYYDSFKEKMLEEFDGGDLYEKQRNKEKNDVDITYNNLFKKCTDIYLNSDDDNDRIKSRNFLIILEYLKKHIYYKSALHKLC